MQPFTLAEVQALIGCATVGFRQYFITRFLTGLHTGEVHGLKWKCVDFERRLIMVRETFVLGVVESARSEGSQRDC